MDELHNYIEQIINAQNNRGLPNFEGYSPIEMQYILYSIFEKNCPIQLLELSKSDYNNIPILNQIKYLLRLIEKSGELKLTTKGFLPTKVVSDIYGQEFIKDEMIESGISKLYKETDAMSINLTRILSELSGIVKKRNNKLSLTKKGKLELNENHRLLKTIITTFGEKFNWAYYDGYGENQIGQLGFGFSLILLSNYGAKKRLDFFYSKKYLSAFPMLIKQVRPSRFETDEKQASSCYSLRTFDRFLDYFGLIQIISDGKLKSDKFIKKTALFDKLIEVRPHDNRYEVLGNGQLN
jgi:predicted transcriptional regulator